jgi:two-component system, chemotaxis family, sensor kinase CheA
MQDDEFIKALRATFNVEADEHLQTISSSLLELEKSPTPVPPLPVIETIYREVHTLKGAARAVDLNDVESICQALEGIFAGWKRESTIVAAKAFDTIHLALDSIRTLIDSQEAQPGAQRDRAKLIQDLRRLQLPTLASTSQAMPVVDQTTFVEAGIGPPAPPRQSRSGDSEKVIVADTVRISAAKLSSQLLQAEEMLAVKILTAERATRVREIAAECAQWDKHWAKVSADARMFGQTIERNGDGEPCPISIAAFASLSNFLGWNISYIRSLESKLADLAAQAERDRHAVAKRVDDLVEDSKKLLMLPFSSLAAVFPKLVRDLSRQQGKEAELVIEGGNVEIDKRILEEMKDALIHVLRNCIDHGVESPAVRGRLGKPARATISVSVAQVDGNKVEILVTDDGAGVELDRVKSFAVRRGLLTEAAAGALSDADALELVFHSDVSTSPTVTAISGRGLGMAIVRSKAEKLGGGAWIESKRHIGTTLRVLLPLSISTLRGIFVKVSGHAYIVPTLSVERVLRVRPQDIQMVEDRETLSLEGSVILLARLDAVLGVTTNPIVDGAPFPVVVLSLAGQRTAFVVEEVLCEAEVLIKFFRKPLVRVRNIVGATIHASGQAVPVLNVADLMKSARLRGTARMRSAALAPQLKGPSKKILVAEDSVTSRMLIKGILEAAGYTVRTAVDGMDAFTILREDQFDLLVSDVEMPRMSGLDLTSRIRSDKHLTGLPVILITALDALEHRESGLRMGANAYIVKSNLDQSDLLAAVKRLA